MKRLLLVLICLLLAGCTPEMSMQEALDISLDRAESLIANEPQRTKELYGYYHEPQVGVLATDRTSTKFITEGATFVMNLDISAIVNDTFYQNAEKPISMIDDQYLVASKTGEYTDFKGVVKPYECHVYKFDDYFVVFEADNIYFYGRGTQTQVAAMVFNMCNIAKTVEIEKDTVLTKYSSKELIVSHKEQLNLFETIVPVNGRVDDLLQSFEIEEEKINKEEIDFDNFATDEFNEEELGW